MPRSFYWFIGGDVLISFLLFWSSRLLGSDVDSGMDPTQINFLDN